MSTDSTDSRASGQTPDAIVFVDSESLPPLRRGRFPKLPHNRKAGANARKQARQSRAFRRMTTTDLKHLAVKWTPPGQSARDAEYERERRERTRRIHTAYAPIAELLPDVARQLGWRI